jgi:hypothetical protein
MKIKLSQLRRIIKEESDAVERQNLIDYVVGTMKSSGNAPAARAMMSRLETMTLEELRDEAERVREESAQHTPTTLALKMSDLNDEEKETMKSALESAVQRMVSDYSIYSQEDLDQVLGSLPDLAYEVASSLVLPALKGIPLSVWFNEAMSKRKLSRAKFSK